MVGVRLYWNCLLLATVIFCWSCAQRCELAVRRSILVLQRKDIGILTQLKKVKNRGNVILLTKSHIKKTAGGLIM